MVYAFDEEFNGPAGSSPDPSKWNWETGSTESLETYTDSRTNSYLDGQGHLVIKALATGSAPPASEVVRRL